MEYTTYSLDYKGIARERLSGKWVIAMLTFFVAGLLGGGDSGGSIDIDAETIQDFQTVFPGLSDMLKEILPILTAILVPLSIWGIVVFIVGSAIDLGLKKFSLDIADNKEVSIEILFSQMRRIGSALGMQLLRSLFITLWSMLFIIPGIIAGYSYAMTDYILAEHPELTASEAIAQSKEMMVGNRFRLFCMEFSFIGWDLLSALTLGIGELWLKPYKKAAKAAFYREVSGTEHVVTPGEGNSMD